MKYIIIQPVGGLGNQLFQIANAYQLSIEFNRRLLICDQNGSSRGVYWNNVLRYFSRHLISKTQFLELKKKSAVYNWASRRFEYKKIVLDPRHDCYCIDGYYQSYKYFDLNAFERLLQFEHNSSNSNKTIEPDGIALHIRRTDYLSKNFHKPLALDYYYNAVERIITDRGSKAPSRNPIHLYIFSDDIEWCKQNFAYSNTDHKCVTQYVTLESELEELYMMSRFSTIVIANSSFSWWAAYLNNTSNQKEVYCPKHWFVNGCHLNTKDMRPPNWVISDDDAPFAKKAHKFDKNVFNVISLGSACCMVQNIHDNIYSDLGPLFRQPANATNFFDWLICDFRFVAYLFENLAFNDAGFLCPTNFTFDDVSATSKELAGGWSQVYRKVEFNRGHGANTTSDAASDAASDATSDSQCGTMIALHDVKKEHTQIPNEFVEKYKRRFERLYNKIKNNRTINLMFCFDFQWLKPYFPLVNEIAGIFQNCRAINPQCAVKLYFFVHPNYRGNPVFEEYKFIDNLELCFLKNKGFHTDWKANNLTFDEFLRV